MNDQEKQPEAFEASEELAAAEAADTIDSPQPTDVVEVPVEQPEAQEPVTKLQPSVTNVASETPEDACVAGDDSACACDSAEISVASDACCTEGGCCTKSRPWFVIGMGVVLAAAVAVTFFVTQNQSAGGSGGDATLTYDGYTRQEIIALYSEFQGHRAMQGLEGLVEGDKERSIDGFIETFDTGLTKENLSAVNATLIVASVRQAMQNGVKELYDSEGLEEILAILELDDVSDRRVAALYVFGQIKQRMSWEVYDIAVFTQVFFECMQYDDTQFSQQVDVFYAHGRNVAHDLHGTEMLIDVEAFVAGMKQAIEQPDLAMNDESIQTLTRHYEAILNEDNRVRNEEYFNNAQEGEGWEVCESGILKKAINPGVAASGSPTSEHEVTFHMEIADIDGHVIGSTFEQTEPSSLPLAELGMEGLMLALQELSPQEEAEFLIPWEKAYGAKGRPPHIRAFSTLRVRVKLLSYQQIRTSE